MRKVRVGLSDCVILSGGTPRGTRAAYAVEGLACGATQSKGG